MTCPHCLKDIHFLPLGNSYGINEQGNLQLLHVFQGAFCPACRNIIVIYKNLMAKTVNGVYPDEEYNKAIIYPKNPKLKPLPSEVAQDYHEDFDEARLVLALSPKSSAALSRRLLQRVLHERFCISKPNLQQEIQEFISTLAPPTHLAQQLDAIRLVGNFAAHPIKDTSTGAIADVEEGEAELLIETLESLFDFAFVQPAKWTAAKHALNARLSATGKPTIP